MTNVLEGTQAVGEFHEGCVFFSRKERLVNNKSQLPS